jgi:mannose-1-phosphate guanylyltransferase
MNIILLSGGSGKRLWPLSNDVRSKQFIKLFRDETGEYESMVQRVYRQITAVDADAKVTIATSKSQASAIKNQLGDKAGICVEPCRRDTFPAILLAAAYLHDVLNVKEEESVAVCPVDPYVDNSYYEAVEQLEKLVEQGSANLTLMGITPTYPSEKYGYIIPEDSEPVSKVKEFKEKPDTETAKKYLAQNALWNAGVFAFRLGYLLEKAHSMVDFTDYQDLYNKYETLTKISFDYAVVEKESSIQVMRYNGSWKDVGTWNMMAEVMADATKGKVVTDDTCENTQVVNELDIPIICMGCKDMVIAASGDGILVSDKERSGYMKPYVEKLDIDPMYAEKSWGSYSVMDVQNNSMTVRISMQAGESMSYHSHDFRKEVWTITSGEGCVVIDDKEQQVKAGDVLTIEAGAKHMMKATTDMGIIEVQLGENISAEDKKKYDNM